MEALRLAGWLTGRRARAYLALVAVAMLILAGAVVGRIALAVLRDPAGRPPISDFAAFHGAGLLAWSGHAASVYDRGAITAAETAGVQPPPGQYLPYFYPPVFTLLCLPLGMLGYLPALAAFSLSGAAAAAALLRRLAPAGVPNLAILAFPGLVMDACIGQTGWISALCFAAASQWLERRPAWAGACLGVLVYRPQLAVCVPVALLAARRWRALAGFGASGAGLCALSALVLGGSAWSAFAAAVPAIGRVPQMADIAPKLLSAFAAVRLLGGSVALAVLAQAALAVLAMAMLAAAAARRPGPAAEGACLVAVSLLCTPYLLDYDLVCLAVPLAWIAGCAAATGWRPWEKVTAAALYVLPMVARTLNLQVGLSPTPVLLAALLTLTVRRVLAPSRSLVAA